MRSLLRPSYVLSAGLVLAAVAALVLWLWPSGDYIFLPDRAHPVAPLVSVRGGHEPKSGGIYFVDVIVRKATLLESLFPSLRGGSSLLPASAVNPGGVSDRQRIQQDLRDMRQSQQVAAAIAFRALGYKIPFRDRGVLIDQVVPRTPASRVLRRGDLIVSVDGRKAGSVCTLRRSLAQRPPGSSFALQVQRGPAVRTLHVRTIAEAGQPILGVLAQNDFRAGAPPVPVRIDTGGVGGPSAGLAFALDLMEQLGRDVVHGHRVAVTGTIEPDGCVAPIGGVKQKTIGARETKVDVFLVPAGDNAQEARRYADGLRIVPVESFRQALHALATLPPKA